MKKLKLGIITFVFITYKILETRINQRQDQIHAIMPREEALVSIKRYRSNHDGP